MPESSCPACQSPSVQLSFEVTADLSAQHFVLREEHPERYARLAEHVRCLWHGDKCGIFLCGNCGFGFANPFIAGDADFYNLAFQQGGYPAMKWDYTRTLESLGSLETSHKTCLDVGAGNGFFLDLISPRLFDPSNVTAIEYNTSAIEKMRAKKYTVLSDDLRTDTFKKYAGKFDFIFMFQILEHMDRIDELFERLFLLCNQNASLFIAVPNAVMTQYQEQSGSLKDMPPNHIGRWTPEAFTSLTKRHAFKIVDSADEPFVMRSFVKQDLYYNYLYRAQRHGSLSNRIRSLPAGKARKALEMAFIALMAPTRMRAWRTGLKQGSLHGNSYWLHLQRQSAQ